MYINPFSLQMTGRKGRVVRRPDGTVRYESRAEQGLTIDHINLKEKDRFMSGEKVRYFTVQKNTKWITVFMTRRASDQSSPNSEML